MAAFSFAADLCWLTVFLRAHQNRTWRFLSNTVGGERIGSKIKDQLIQIPVKTYYDLSLVRSRLVNDFSLTGLDSELSMSDTEGSQHLKDGTSKYVVLWYLIINSVNWNNSEEINPTTVASVRSGFICSSVDLFWNGVAVFWISSDLIFCFWHTEMRNKSSKNSALHSVHIFRILLPKQRRHEDTQKKNKNHRNKKLHLL